MTNSILLENRVKARRSILSIENVILITFFLNSTVIILYSIIFAKEQTSMTSKVRVQLQESSGKPSDDTSLLSHISIFVEADQVQPNVAQGIQLVMEIVNERTDTISIRDPMDFSTIEVLNEEGWPITLPPVKRRIFTNTRARRGEPDPNMIQPEIDLAPGERHRLTFRVQQILVEGAITPIPAGRYKLSIRTILIPAQADESTPKLSKKLVSDFIMVNLGN